MVIEDPERNRSNLNFVASVSLSEGSAGRTYGRWRIERGFATDDTPTIVERPNKSDLFVWLDDEFIREERSENMADLDNVSVRCLVNGRNSVGFRQSS